jgi:pimeloyl-ACP methyl ester carboxylesterase
MRVDKAYIRTSQGELHLRRCGETGPELVMLQILPFATAMFEPLLPLLAQAGLRCTAIDLMGYGRSDKRPAIWMVEDFAANIDEAIDRLQITPECLLGGHFAGMVAANVAIARTGQVRRLVLDGTPVWPPDYRANIAAEMGVKPFTVTEDGQFMTDTWAQVMAMMRLLNKGFELTDATAAALRGFAVQLLETTYGPSVVPAMAGFDMAALLPKLTLETLILTSENDSQVRFFQTLMDGIAGARGRIFPGVHPMHDIGHPERVREYTDELVDFLLK